MIIILLNTEMFKTNVFNFFYFVNLQITLKNLSNCLRLAIDNFKSSDGETDRIKYLLEWVIDTYDDIDF